MSGWQDATRDFETRSVVVQKIIALLYARKSEPDLAWIQKVPTIAQRLEGKLYRGAASLAAYSDESTLKPRLKEAARDIKSAMEVDERARVLEVSASVDEIAKHVVLEMSFEKNFERVT